MKKWPNNIKSLKIINPFDYFKQTFLIEIIPESASDPKVTLQMKRWKGRDIG